MDLPEEDVVERVQDSGFLDDSSLGDMFPPAGFDQGQELSRISKDESGENQLDQGMIGDSSKDREDGAGKEDVLDFTPAEDINNFEKVQRFDRALLSNAEIELAIKGEFSEEPAKHPPKDAEPAPHKEDSSRREQVEIEGTSVQSTGWRCSVCLTREQSTSLESFCVLY